MSTISTSSTSRWTAYAAWTQLRNSPRRPAITTADSHDQRSAATQTAVADRRTRTAPLRPGHTLDITV